jgi:hypothetical protein
MSKKTEVLCIPESLRALIFGPEEKPREPLIPFPTAEEIRGQMKRARRGK